MGGFCACRMHVVGLTFPVSGLCEAILASLAVTGLAFFHCVKFGPSNCCFGSSCMSGFPEGMFSERLRTDVWGFRPLGHLVFHWFTYFCRLSGWLSFLLFVGGGSADSILSGFS